MQGRNQNSSHLQMKTRPKTSLKTGPVNKNNQKERSQNDQQLIVISILEGRNFQKRSGYSLIIEARLDGELMSTDEVDHVEHPYINTELAWEVNREALKIFRMQRTPIKLQCLAVNPKTGAKEIIGFIILDLRLLHSKPPTFKWYPLLHNKYHWIKPELQIGFHLEKDFGRPKQDVLPASPEKREKNVGYPSIERLRLEEEPVLNENESYYQLGPADVCNTLFSLSLTIYLAENLIQLVPSIMHLPKTQEGFYFFYMLVGNEVITDTFPDLITPSFAPERATVRIRSSPEVLHRFFTSHPSIQIHLCAGDVSLGCADVPLNKLLGKNVSNVLKKPAMIESAFPLKPLRDDVPLSKTSPAVVGISLCLQLNEKVKEKEIVIEEPKVLNENKSYSPYSSSEEELSKPENDSYSPCPKSPPVRLKKENKNSKQDLKSSSSLEQLHEDNDKDLAKEITKLPEHEFKNAKVNNSPRLTGGQDLRKDYTVSAPKKDGTVHQNSELELHRYCFIVDIRHLRFHSMTNSIFCFIRYSYPFFGTSASIVTYPPVEVRGNPQVSVPHGFCAFTFAASYDQLVLALQNLPLKLEVVQRDKQKNEDVVLGTSNLNLALTLQVNKSRITTEENKVGYRQISSFEAPIVASDGKEFGDLYIITSLDDFGIIDLDETRTHKIQKNYGQGSLINKKVHSDSEASNLPSWNEMPRKEHLSGLPSEPRAAASGNRPNTDQFKEMAVQVALELEQWKAAQQDHFKEQLKEKESKYLDSLANEWRKRETERELLYQRRITECEEMQDKLQRALFDIDKRERILSSKEQELHRDKVEFDQKCERQEKEIKLGYLRMQEDFNHRLKLEKEKTEEAENQKMKLELQVNELERKLESKCREFENYREEQRNNPEMRLESEIHLLSMEKSELERKLESATKSKVHYKQQWGRCLRELASIKQKMQANARAELYKQQKELESMRLQYLSSEGKDGNVVLQEIKSQINELSEKVSKSKAEDGENATTKSRHISFLDSDVESDNGIEIVNIGRLKKERELLLQTGIYTQEDRIICELDRQIREAVLRNAS